MKCITFSHQISFRVFGEILGYQANRDKFSHGDRKDL